MIVVAIAIWVTRSITRRNDLGLAFGANKYVCAVGLLDYFTAIWEGPDFRDASWTPWFPALRWSKRIEWRLLTPVRITVRITVWITV